MIFKQDISEEYPSDFNMEEFKNLKSYNARLKYASEKLKRIGSGSARVVFKIDDEKVLKVAKNTKGIAQNEKEASYSNDYYIENIIATTFDYHPDFQWIEMELAQKLTPTKFKEVTGVDIKELDQYLRYEHERINSNRKVLSIDPEFEEKMQENEFVVEIVDYMGNYGIPAGDLGRLSSYGLVKRNGEDRVVLIDYGLDDDILKTYYQKEGYSKVRGVVREIVNEVLGEDINIKGNQASLEKPFDDIKKFTVNGGVVYALFGDVLYYPNKESILAIKGKSNKLELNNKTYKEFLKELKRRFYSIPELANSDLLVSIETSSNLNNDIMKTLGKPSITNGFKKKDITFQMKKIPNKDRKNVKDIFSLDFDLNIKNICVVDDFITSGGSFRNAFDLIPPDINRVGFCLFKLV